MRILIFSAYNDFSAIESAYTQLQLGNDVTVLLCDKSSRICMHNFYGSNSVCLLCHRGMKRAWKNSGLLDKVKIKDLSSFITNKDKEFAEIFDLNYNSIEELKALDYKGTEVGYGAFSSYVSITRNAMPNITEEFKRYINFMIRKEIELHEALERYIYSEKPELIIFHNGRFSNYKPFLCLSQKHKINFIATEHTWQEGKLLKNFFYNNTPHELKPIIERMRENWEKGKLKEDVEKLGKEFYERRRKGLAAGDVVYTAAQLKGKLPVGWDATKENIAIFNSSEDEFCAVSKKFDTYLLFPTQYDALKSIFEHYKNDSNKHFYVRIHPNLKNVPFKSHLKLYELEYPNVTFIRPESQISSYDLMDVSSKILIFNSTIGIEATYWRKPVIALTYFYYSELDAVYTPKNENELWQFIDNKDLKDKYNHDVILYGYYLYKYNLPPIEFVKYKKMDFSILGKKICEFSIMKICGSYRVLPFIDRFQHKISSFLPGKVFKSIPGQEAYNGEY